MAVRGGTVTPLVRAFGYVATEEEEEESREGRSTSRRGGVYYGCVSLTIVDFDQYRRDYLFPPPCDMTRVLIVSFVVGETDITSSPCTLMNMPM